MARQIEGINGGFAGKVGTVIGYEWRGKWCMRSYPRRIRDRRSEAQLEQRSWFVEAVRFASRLVEVLRVGLRQPALAMHLTEGNLFVKANKHLFGIAGGRLAVDYKPAGAERRPGGARGLRAPGGRRERARADGGLQLQSAAAALQRGRQGVPGGHRRRLPGGRTGPAHLPAQGDRDNRAALAMGSPGGAPLQHGADIRKVHVAKPVPWQRAP